MSRLATLWIVMVLSTAAQAGADPEVVNAMLQNTKGIPREEIEANFDACDSGVTSHMKICFAYRWTVQDIRMNREYQLALALAKRVEADGALRIAQRSWIAFRDKECAFQGHIEAGGGSAEGVVVLGCKMTVTGERADQLAKLVRQYSGGRGQ